MWKGMRIYIWIFRKEKIEFVSVYGPSFFQIGGVFFALIRGINRKVNFCCDC